MIFYKRTVSVNSSNPPSKDGNARFTTVPLKPLSDQHCQGYSRFSRLNSDNFYMFFCRSNAQVTFLAKPQSEMNSFQNYKHWYLIHTKLLTCTVVYRVLLNLFMEGHLSLRIQSFKMVNIFHFVFRGLYKWFLLLVGYSTNQGKKSRIGKIPKKSDKTKS